MSLEEYLKDVESTSYMGTFELTDEKDILKLIQIIRIQARAIDRAEWHIRKLQEGAAAGYILRNAENQIEALIEKA